MDIAGITKSAMENIDEETLKWLFEFTTWKRRKAADPSDVHIRFVLEYMAKYLYFYYFIHRNYNYLVPLLEAYDAAYGNVEGLTRLIEVVGKRLGR